jgi:hypothetical protein
VGRPDKVGSEAGSGPEWRDCDEAPDAEVRQPSQGGTRGRGSQVVRRSQKGRPDKVASEAGSGPEWGDCDEAQDASVWQPLQAGTQGRVSHKARRMEVGMESPSPNSADTRGKERSWSAGRESSCPAGSRNPQAG